MAQRQLNILSDEAADRASSLAARLGKTTTEVVVEALRAYEKAEPLDGKGFTPDQRRRYDALVAVAEEAQKHRIPGAVFDDSWMYDEDGLPK